jgi:phage head maturation protease
MATGVLAKMSRGDVSGSSFWFEPVSDDDEQHARGASGQLPLRTLKRLRLIEVGPVVRPAYEATSASAQDARLPEAMRRRREARAAIEHANRQATPETTE